MKIKKRITEEAHKIAKPGDEERKRLHRKVFIILAIILAVILLGVGGFIWFYNGRAMPNVSVAGADVSSQTDSAIRDAVNKQASNIGITFDLNGEKKTIPAKDLGVTVNTDATVQNVLNARRSGNLWQNLLVTQNINVPLVLNSDPGVLIDYVKKTYPDLYVNAKEPEVVFNEDAGKYEVKAGEAGKGLDMQAFQRTLNEIAQQPQNYTFKVTSAPTQPILDQSKLATAADKANQMIQQKVEFKLNGEVIYTAEPAQIASWIHFVPDAASGNVNIEVDKAGVEQFINDSVAPTVASSPVDRKVVVDSSTGAETVLQQGRSGSQLQDAGGLANNVVNALNQNQPIVQDVTIETAPFKTVTMTGSGKWIEVDLTKQRLTLYIGNQVVDSFLASTGTARTPTEVGEFAIYSKVASMTMTGTIAGDYFYLPNVKWVNFFNGGAAIHGTYWHNNFGHPMSHGCVNLSEANAKIVYDFAPVGTKVIVHY